MLCYLVRIFCLCWLLDCLTITKKYKNFKYWKIISVNFFFILTNYKKKKEKRKKKKEKRKKKKEKRKKKKEKKLKLALAFDIEVNFIFPKALVYHCRHMFFVLIENIISFFKQ
jgi:predicted histidine transporter YuiF (NhaC family)